jgi:hypothetical protein
MNSLKNLMIIGVLAAVGYGVYASLSRNNVDSEQPFGALKGDTSHAKSAAPRGLPLSGSSLPPVGANSLGSGGPALPPLTPPALAAANPPPGVSNAAPALPLPSSASGSNTLTPPALSPPALPVGPTSNPTATLGAPVPPDAPSSAASPKAAENTLGTPPLPPEPPTSPASAVRNLAPPPDVTAGATAAATAVPARDAATPSDSSLQNEFNALMDAVRKKLEEGKFAEAQLALSGLYGDPNLPADQAKQITALLDQLAGTVIYSREHYLAPPYVTQAGDTIDTVAKKYNLPWQLLARINGVMPPTASNAADAVKDQPLPAGKQLKVLQGPFDAVIQLDKKELTLMVQNRYAARFRIGVGRDQPKLEGEYTVRNKTLNPTYYGPDGVNISPSDPKNPLGAAWIGLTDRVGIHGAPDPQSVGCDNNRGTICVSDRDLQDLYGILSVGSRVTIVR